MAAHDVCVACRFVFSLQIAQETHMPSKTLKYIATAAVAGLTSVAASGFAADASGLSSKDKTFMKKAAQAGTAEIGSGTLADSNSSNDQVKNFGREMVKDHTAAANELSQIAQAKGFTLPGEPDSSHKRLLKRLGKEGSPKFDKDYASKAGVDDHKDAVKLFTDEANHGKDADVKAYAAKTLPTLQHHYQMAQELASSLGVK
jgi:putative membrane protein